MTLITVLYVKIIVELQSSPPLGRCRSEVGSSFSGSVAENRARNYGVIRMLGESIKSKMISYKMLLLPLLLMQLLGWHLKGLDHLFQISSNSDKVTNYKSWIRSLPDISTGKLWIIAYEVFGNSTASLLVQYLCISEDFDEWSVAGIAQNGVTIFMPNWW